MFGKLVLALCWNFSFPNSLGWLIYCSMSGQDEANPVLWLATRGQDGAILTARDCPLCSRKKTKCISLRPSSHIINPLLTKLVRSRFRDIGLVSFNSLWHYFYGLWECRPWKNVINLLIVIKMKHVHVHLNCETEQFVKSYMWLLYFPHGEKVQMMMYILTRTFQKSNNEWITFHRSCWFLKEFFCLVIKSGWKEEDGRICLRHDEMTQFLTVFIPIFLLKKKTNSFIK